MVFDLGNSDFDRVVLFGARSRNFSGSPLETSKTPPLGGGVPVYYTMNKYFLKIIPIVLITLLAFNFVSAATFQDFSTPNNTDLIITNLTGVERAAQGRFSFTQTGSVGAVQLLLKKTGSPTSTITVNLVAVSGGNNPEEGTIVATSTIDGSTLTTSYASTTFTFTTPVNIISTSQLYFLKIYQTTGASNSDYYSAGSDGTGNALANQNVWRRSGGNWTSEATAWDMYMVFGDASGLLGFGFIYPTNGLENITDFAHWEVAAGNLVSRGDIFWVDYSQNSATTTSVTSLGDSIVIFSATSTWSDPNTFTDPTSDFLIQKNRQLANGVWYAMLFHYDSNLHFIEQTEPIVFSVGQQNSTIYNFVQSINDLASTTLDNAITQMNTTCDNASTTITQVWQTYGTGEGLQCVFQRSLNFGLRLFIFPHSFSQEILKQQWEGFKTVFPFSAFFKITDTALTAINDQTLAPAKSVEYTWETPRLLSANGVSVLTASSADTITFASSSTLESLIGASTVLILFNGILLLAILWSLYIIYRLLFH